MPAVEVEELVVRYGGLTAVDRLSFTAEPGRITALLGPNGAGKTSTIEVLEGYRRAAAGRVRVAGLDPAADHGELVNRIGIMLQTGGVYPTIRALEVLELFCAFHGNRRRPLALLDVVGLSGRARSTWKQLSGGEQQRLSLALALAGKPEVVILDEPTAGVDVAGRQVVRQVVRDLAGTGVCVVLTTHELDEAERLADHVLIIDQGRLVASGSPDELRSLGGTDEVRFAARPGLATGELAAALGAAVDEVSPGEYVVRAAGGPQLVAALTAWLAARDLSLGDLRAGRQRLEDVFLRLTGGGGTPSGGTDESIRPRRRARGRS